MVFSQAAERHDVRRFLDVPGLGRRLHLQPTAAGRFPGHEPAAVPLLHLLVPQHLPDGGPAPRTEQRGGIHQVPELSGLIPAIIEKVVEASSSASELSAVIQTNKNDID